MDSYSAEKLLSICYPLIIALSVICSAVSAVVWSHWKYVLDTCVETNCGCFLYGLSTRTYFTGGHIAFCHFIVYGLILPILLALILGSYHVFRICMGKSKKRSGTATIRQKTGEMVVVTTHSEVIDDGISPYYWIQASVVSAIMSFYGLVYASIYTDGYNQTCYQYRTELVKLIQSTGNMVEAIQGRLSCGAIFDFMDYLHTDVSFDRRRIGRINSPICYQLALFSCWLTVFCWITVCCINIIVAKRSRPVRV